jgi:hypothetical protein
MNELTNLPPAAFTKADPSPDAEFYATPRFVKHIDDGAVAAVTEAYRAVLPPGGVILDLMSSWISHLPDEVRYASVIGHGMNAEELGANKRLKSWFVQDLNIDPALPLKDRSVDGACLCVSVQYLQRPVEVFRQVNRVLRPGAPFVVSFSNRCFPTKAVAIWQALAAPDQQRLVAAYMAASGFTGVTASDETPFGGDPLWTVVGRSPPV